MERADVNGSQRMTFRTDPERAIPLLEYALKRPKIRNPAAFAVARFRAGQGVPVLELVREQEEAPSTSTIEELQVAIEAAPRLGLPAAVVAAMQAELLQRTAS